MSIPAQVFGETVDKGSNLAGLSGRLRVMTYKLVLLRHGQSAWNKTNQFTGWVDVPLTEQGEAEAKRGGELLKEKNVLPDIVFTSLLRRAINTANIALDAADRLWIPVQRDWRLNERHYGALQGKNKTEIRQEYGDEKFMLWRRSYATPPPEIDPNDQYAQNHDPRYAGDPVPEAECLANVVERVKPYFESAIEPELRTGKTVLIAAHGNSLRAIVKMLDNLSEDEIAKVNIPTAIPLLYELDENFKPVKPRGEYLDPEAAAAGAAAVAAPNSGTAGVGGPLFQILGGSKFRLRKSFASGFGFTALAAPPHLRWGPGGRLRR